MEGQAPFFQEVGTSGCPQLHNKDEDRHLALESASSGLLLQPPALLAHTRDREVLAAAAFGEREAEEVLTQDSPGQSWEPLGTCPHASLQGVTLPSFNSAGSGVVAEG